MASRDGSHLRTAESGRSWPSKLRNILIRTRRQQPSQQPPREPPEQESAQRVPPRPPRGHAHFGLSGIANLCRWPRTTVRPAMLPSLQASSLHHRDKLVPRGMPQYIFRRSDTHSLLSRGPGRDGPKIPPRAGQKRQVVYYSKFPQLLQDCSSASSLPFYFLKFSSTAKGQRRAAASRPPERRDGRGR